MWNIASKFTWLDILGLNILFFEKIILEVCISNRKTYMYEKDLRETNFHQLELIILKQHVSNYKLLKFIKEAASVSWLDTNIIFKNGWWVVTNHMHGPCICEKSFYFCICRMNVKLNTIDKLHVLIINSFKHVKCSSTLRQQILIQPLPAQLLSVCLV